ncbi:MAG: hypothetical protein FJX44_08235 [Alphaproteobacteria bacterium]|nr:hypothetical protein [Alphaproteobacteria bacterium]
MGHWAKYLGAATVLLVLPNGTALAAKAVVSAPVNVHAARSDASAVIATIQPATTINATNCRNGWCAAAGGYVRSATLRFGRADKQRGVAYDYNVPLAFPPYGYTPGFWGYGGRRYYDKYGNYTKYQEGIPSGGAGPLETIPRSRLR